MNTSNKFKRVLCTVIFSFAFTMATTILGFCCRGGFMEEPKAPKALLKR